MKINEIKPSRDLYNQVRGGFITKGSSLSKWCKGEGLNVQNALSCLVGTWNGPKAKDWRVKLVDASGISISLPVESDSKPSHQGAA